MKREGSAPEEFVSRTEALAASIIENALGEVRTIPNYADRLVVLATIEGALRAERDDVYEVMEGSSDIDQEALVMSYVQSYDSRRAAEPLIRQEVVQELAELVKSGEITGDHADAILLRLEPFYSGEDGPTV